MGCPWHGSMAVPAPPTGGRDGACGFTVRRHPLVGDYSQVRAVVVFGVIVLICLIQQLANMLPYLQRKYDSNRGKYLPQ